MQITNLTLFQCYKNMFLMTATKKDFFEKRDSKTACIIKHKPV